MYVCPNVSELCFYGCCHPCLIVIFIVFVNVCVPYKNHINSLFIYLYWSTNASFVDGYSICGYIAWGKCVVDLSC